MGQKKTKGFDLALGTWRMRNGHTVEIRDSKSHSYTNPNREIVMWTGWCADLGHAISWIGVGRGRYTAHGTHGFDIVARISATAGPTRKKAA